MDLLECLRRQFAYDAWANGEILIALRAGSEPPERVLQLMAHIFSAERLWLERITRQPQSLPVWPEFDLERCETQMGALAGLWHEYFDQLTASGLSEPIAYKNSKGETWTSTVQDVLTHVALHSAYHRGQIATLLRSSGQTPAHTDFIHAVWQGFIE